MNEMTAKHRFGKFTRQAGKAGALSVATFSRLGSLFILTILIGRISGAEALGYFSVLLASASMFQAISVGGLSGVAIHKLLKSGANVTQEIAIISTARKLLIPIIFVIGSVLYFILTVPNSGQVIFTILFFAGYAFGSYDVDEIRLTAVGRFSLIGWRRTGAVLVLAIPKFWAASMGYFEISVVIQALEAAVWQAVLGPRTSRTTRQPALGSGLFQQTLAQIWQVRRLWLSGVAATFAQRVDLFVVGALLSIGAAGQYSTASRPVEAAVVVAVSLVAVLFNAIVRVSEDPSRYLDSVSRGSRTVFLVGLSMTVIFVFVGPFALELLYGSTFAPAASVLPLYALSLIFVFQRQFISRIIIIEGMYGLSLTSNITSLVVNVLLNLWLIPSMGLYGAALAAVLTHPIALGLTFLPSPGGRRILIMTYGPLVSRNKSLLHTASTLIHERS